MQTKYFFFIGILSFAFFSFSIDSITNSNEPYFYEYGGFDEEGNEITLLFLTKTGYDSLIVPTNNANLVNFLLQVQENNNALSARIDELETGNLPQVITGDINMNGYKIYNASDVQTELFTAKPVQ